MILKNASVFLKNRFEICDVAVENGKIAAIGPDLGPGEDCTGLRLLPGLVDIHTHGCAGYDFDHADGAQLAEMSACYLRHGVTAVLATLMTNPKDLLLEAAARCGAAPTPIRGIYLEGPFFGPSKKGAHDAQYLSPIDSDFFAALDKAAGGAIRIVAVDPCLEEAEDFIRAKNALYGRNIMMYNSIERVASALVSAVMEGHAPFDVQKVFDSVTLEDICCRLDLQLKPERMAISVITPEKA